MLCRVGETSRCVVPLIDYTLIVHLAEATVPLRHLSLSFCSGVLGGGADAVSTEVQATLEATAGTTVVHVDVADSATTAAGRLIDAREADVWGTNHEEETDRVVSFGASANVDQVCADIS